MKKILLLCLCLPQLSISQVSCYFDINFDTSSQLISIDATAGNIWQIGAPQKSPFWFSYSPPNAIVTDTINPYPVNNTSSFTFIFPLTQCAFFNNSDLTFWHKYEMDSLADFGLIEESFNGGATWHALTTNSNDTLDSIPLVMHYWEYDMDSSGNYLTQPDSMVTGNSNGWIRSRYTWTWWLAVLPPPGLPPLNPDTILIRFTFKSDSNNNAHAGWMIDNIYARSWFVGGIEEDISGTGLTLSPNPATNQLRIQNTELRIKNIEIYNVLGESVYQSESAKTEIDISNLNPGIYFVKVFTDKTNFSGKFVKE